jgi:hypothetical protein
MLDVCLMFKITLLLRGEIPQRSDFVTVQRFNLNWIQASAGANGHNKTDTPFLSVSS